MVFESGSQTSDLLTWGQVLTVVGSIASSLIVALVVSLLTRRSDHSKWLRETRFAAYEEFLVRSDLAGMNWNRANYVLTPEQMERLYSSLNGVALAGPYKMYELARGYQDHAHQFLTNLPGMSDKDFADGWRLYSADRAAFVKAAWKSLKIRDGGLPHA